MNRLLVAVALAVACVAVGCVSDYEDPYADYVSPDFNWPTFDPNRYHWDGITNPFYESWHYKIADPQSGRSFVFVYGVQNPGGRPDQPSGAFLYALRDDGESLYSPRPLSAFDASVTGCDVKVGPGRATETHITGSLDDGPDSIRWDLSIEVLAEWTETMGVLKNIPALPVNWYVNALNARATGSVVWRGETFTLTGAPAYNDHDWGSVYPESWVSVQANGFENDDDALAAAGGPVALGPIEPPAFMIVFKSGGRLYEYRSQDINTTFKIDASVVTGRVEITATKGDERLVIVADADPDELVPLLVPTVKGMTVGALQAFGGAFIVDRLVKQDGQWMLAKRSASPIGSVEFGGLYAGLAY